MSSATTVERVPGASLADDLDLIGHLDWAPPCDGPRKGCDATATHRLTGHHACCGHRYDFLLCRKHLDLLLGQLDEAIAVVVCEACRAVRWGPAKLADLIHVDSVTPLSGGA